ncbi:MAG: cell division protein ZipA C-terminal FtsZ-binding domain-containing protein [Betaproteobacteria bacterium]
MSQLQLLLLALGAVFILGVVVDNVWQERRARKHAEKAFGPAAGDALFARAAAEGERREPTMGALPRGEAADARNGAGLVAPDELEAPGGPAAEISSRIDTVAVILADDPVMREQLEPLLDALQNHTTPVHVEGIVDEQWHPIETSPRRSWRELRVGLQLASRSGPVTEDEIERFNQAIADFAASVNAVSQREAPAAAATRARELDNFCAEADIEVAVNVIGRAGTTFAASRVKSLALAHGFSETASGDLVHYSVSGVADCSIRRFGDAPGTGNPAYYAGLTFALDLPQVGDPPTALDRMVDLAAACARELAGELVDDNRRPLTEAGIAAIRRSLEKIAGDMQEHGIPAGSALAHRLFA